MGWARSHGRSQISNCLAAAPCHGQVALGAEKVARNGSPAILSATPAENNHEKSEGEAGVRRAGRAARRESGEGRGGGVRRRKGRRGREDGMEVHCWLAAFDSGAIIVSDLGRVARTVTGCFFRSADHCDPGHFGSVRCCLCSVRFG